MWVWVFLAGQGREQFSGDSVSVLLCESAQRRDGGPQISTSWCFYLFIFLFFSWSRDHLWLTARKALQPAPTPGAWAALCAHWAVRCTAQLNHPTDSLMRDRSGEKETLWGEDGQASKSGDPSPNTADAHEATVHLRGKSQPQMPFNLALLYRSRLLPNSSYEQKRQERTVSHNPFHLTNGQTIAGQLIRGLTVTECNAWPYPNHYYFPWLRFEAVSIQAHLQSDFHSVLSAFLLFCSVI